jgi:hypothetical protein
MSIDKVKKCLGPRIENGCSSGSPLPEPLCSIAPDGQAYFAPSKYLWPGARECTAAEQAEFGFPNLQPCR